MFDCDKRSEVILKRNIHAFSSVRIANNREHFTHFAEITDDILSNMDLVEKLLLQWLKDLGCQENT